MANLEITTEKCFKLIEKYYESINANGLLPKIKTYANNTENTHLVIDDTLFTSVINHTISPISEDSELIEGYLLVPYKLFCRTPKVDNSSKNIFSEHSSDIEEVNL